MSKPGQFTRKQIRFITNRFEYEGWMVAAPEGSLSNDIIIERNGQFARVNVRFATRQDYDLPRTKYEIDPRSTREGFTDYFIVAQHCYLIPRDVLKDRSSIVISRPEWNRYKFGPHPDSLMTLVHEFQHGRNLYKELTKRDLDLSTVDWTNETEAHIARYCRGTAAQIGSWGGRKI